MFLNNCMEINSHKSIRLKCRLTKLLLPVKNIIIYPSRNLGITLDNSLSPPLYPVNQKSSMTFSSLISLNSVYLLVTTAFIKAAIIFGWITIVVFSYLSHCILNGPFCCPKAFHKCSLEVFFSYSISHSKKGTYHDQSTHIRI